MSRRGKFIRKIWHLLPISKGGDQVKIEGLQIGRVVHFVDLHGAHKAGMIVDIRDEPVGGVDIFMLPTRKEGGMVLPNVWYSARNDEPGSWHWPERV